MSKSDAQITDGQAFIIGGLLGYVIAEKHTQNTIYAVPDTYNGVVQPPIVIHPSQVGGYSDKTHGFCAPYINEAYYTCLGNLQRIRNENAYYKALRR
jgi:hypothetical protein